MPHLPAVAATVCKSDDNDGTVYFNSAGIEITLISFTSFSADPVFDCGEASCDITWELQF
jgi:hypothetical protein